MTEMVFSRLPESGYRNRGLLALIATAAFCTFIPTARAGEPVDLDALRGQVVYLDFWASWCAPCRQSFPWMQEMYTAFASQGLAIIAVDVDRQRQDAEKFLASYRPAFAVQFDPNGEIAERFQVKGMPTGLLIDRHGAVRFRHIGFRPVDRAIYEQQLRQLLEEP